MVGVKVQTMFRESEAQTLPWSPPYVQKSEETPEVLLLDYLRWNRGLPASLYEAELITRNRKKRAWDLYLSALHDKSKLNFKKKIITQIETDDWEFISQDLEKTNEYRLELAKKVLEEQRIDFTTKLSARADRLNKKIARRYNEGMNRIEHERDKEIRRINSVTKQKYVDRHRQKTIIDEFSDKLSDMYGFRVKSGYRRKNKSIVLCEDAYNKAEDDKVTQRKFSPPNRAGKTKKHNCLKQHFVDGKDAEFDHYFNELDCKYIAQRNKRTPAEIIELENKSQSTRNSSVDRSSRSTVERSDDGQKSQDDEQNRELKRQRILNRFKQTCLEKFRWDSEIMKTNNVEQCLLAKILDLTSKEQQRVEEEKRILAVALVAQAERWKREAREDGIRQKQKMRIMIKRQILENAFERISRDLDNELEDVLRDSIMDTAVVQAEEDMRVKLLDIDRTRIPKIDSGTQQEETIDRLKALINEKTGEGTVGRKKEELASDLGEIMDAVDDMYQDIITVAVDLDNLVTTLNDAETKESKLELVQEKIQNLMSTDYMSPTLETIKDQIKQIENQCLLHKEINEDIKNMDRLCDGIIEIASELYRTVITDINIDQLKNRVDNYDDLVVDDQLLQYLDPRTNLYIFKLFKLNHLLSKNNDKEKLLTDDSIRIYKNVKGLCKNITDVAAKIHYFISVNEYETVSDTGEAVESLETEIKSGDIYDAEQPKAVKMERLCKKLFAKMSTKKITEKVKTHDRFKIDICEIKNEAAEIIESVFEIWLALSSIVDRLASTTDDAQLKEEVEEKLKCVMEILQNQFGIGIEHFIGIKEYRYMVDPTNYNRDVENIIKQLYVPNMLDVEDVVDAILKTAIQLYNRTQSDVISLINEIELVQEPLKSDFKSMSNEPNIYLTVPKHIE